MLISTENKDHYSTALELVTNAYNYSMSVFRVQLVDVAVLVLLKQVDNISMAFGSGCFHSCESILQESIIMCAIRQSHFYLC